MTNWSTYTITSKTTNSSYITFNLDSSLNYKNGSRFFIDLTRTLPYTEWGEGDRIMIDTDKTRQNESSKTFSFYENVALQSSSRLENKFNEAVREKGNTERERSEWKTKYYDKNRQYEEYKDKYDDARRDLDNSYQERIRITNENATERLKQKEVEARLRIEKGRIEEKLESAKNREKDLTKLLEDGKNELSLVRTEKNNEIAKIEKDLKQERMWLEEVHRSMADLRVEYGKESAEKDSTIKEREEELKRKEEETKKIQVKLGLSQEKVLEQEIRSKSEKLDLFANELKIDLEQLQNLRDYYEEKISYRLDRTKSREVERKIVLVKKEFSQSGIQMEKVQKICRKCEKLAELRSRLDQIIEQQQQYQAHQEQPTNNN